MQKSITSRAYVEFLKKFRQTREDAGLTQVELASRVGVTQSFLSKCERGERRIDVIELRTLCLAMGTTLERFVRGLEKVL